MTQETEGAIVEADASTKLALSRTVIAHERTTLAWTRTATSLITFGFSIQQFFRITRGAAQPDHLIGPQEVGLAMIIIGLVALLLQTVDHRSAIQELKAQYPVSAGFPSIRRSRAQMLAALIALLGLLALVVMFFRG